MSEGGYMCTRCMTGFVVLEGESSDKHKCSPKRLKKLKRMKVTTKENSDGR